MSHLFTPIQIRDLKIRNRVFMSPMCMYSSENGFPNEWHLVHLGARATGGVGLVMTEATAVSPEGRISPNDAGLWSKEHADRFRPITDFIKSQGATPAIQLAHAGRKAGTARPWEGGKPLKPGNGGWEVVAPSAIPFADGYQTPRELSLEDLDRIETKFKEATELALQAGFDVVEIHMAHGYLFHEFLSPLSNQRKDDYGGSLENRMRFPLRVARAVRAAWPEDKPVFVRISGTDWADGGWDLEQSVVFCSQLKEIGIDLIDCSSGGLVPHGVPQVAPGYQVPIAETIRSKCEIKTGAVGLITDPKQAEDILASGRADAIFIGRELLRNPYWALQAAKALGDDIPWPPQYLRAK